MQITGLLPGPMIGKFASIAKFSNNNVVPLVGLSGSFVQGIKSSYMRSTPPPAPVPLASTATTSRAPPENSPEQSRALALDDPSVVEDLRKHITMFKFAEPVDGISADAQLFMRKPRSIPWCSPSISWSDIDDVVPLISDIINEDKRLNGDTRKWTIQTFHAEKDDMVGEKGRLWFDNCWAPSQASSPSADTSLPQPDHQQPNKAYEYKSEIVRDTDHDYLMDPAFGASKLWLQQVREAFPTPVEV